MTSTPRTKTAFLIQFQEDAADFSDAYGTTAIPCDSLDEAMTTFWGSHGHRRLLALAANGNVVELERA